MKIGQKVVVICTQRFYDGDHKPMPRVGTVGVIWSEIDEFDEYDVLFDGYPCLPLDPSWVLHKSLVVPVDETFDLLENPAFAVSSEDPKSDHW